MSFSIKAWNHDDRPREKMLHKGAGSLSDAELLAILIGSGTPEKSAVELARNILSIAGNSLDNLAQMQANEISSRVKGIGPAKAVSIAAAFEISRRRNATGSNNSTAITSSSVAAATIAPVLSDLNHEEFWLLLLNNSNRCINKVKLSEGGLTATIADIRIALKHAIINNATAIILFHNHPSGICSPSPNDISLTKKFCEGALCMDVSLLDHIIICGKNKYYSFADNGMLSDALTKRSTGRFNYL